MQPVSFQDQIEACLKKGEQLVPISKIPALKSIPSTTRVDWCRTGKIPATQVGGQYLSVESLVIRALAARTVKTATPKPERVLNHDLERVKQLNAK